MATYTPALTTPPVAASRAQLQEQIDLLTHHWHTCTEEELAERPGPGRWSRKEILGHLVDSATNNYRRIVLASLAPPPHQLRPYDQEAWVRVADYQHYPADDLLLLWRSQNQLILHVLRRLPPHLLDSEYLTLNGNPTTLHWLISDYALHLEHHVQQIINFD
jgi:hypothetical protein